MLLGLLLTLNILVCLALIGVVLLQRSEGGALGGGSPTGLITTRGAGDLLTRTTWILFTLFLTISLALTLIGGRERSSQAILSRLKQQSINPDTVPAPGLASQPAIPATAPNQTPPPTVRLPAAKTAPVQARGLSAPTPRVRLPIGSGAAAAATPLSTPQLPAPTAPTPKVTLAPLLPPAPSPSTSKPPAS